MPTHYTEANLPKDGLFGRKTLQGTNAYLLALVLFVEVCEKLQMTNMRLCGGLAPN
jgi:hypothetical protein